MSPFQQTIGLAFHRVGWTSIALAFCTAAATARQTSVMNGVWTNPAVWSTNQVPGPGAMVVVGHTVGLQPPAFAGWQPSVDIGAGTITVLGSGELIPTWPDSASGLGMRVVASAILVQPNGVIRGQHAPQQSTQSAGNVHLVGSFLPAGVPSMLTNHGTIQGGSGGARGGSVWLDYFDFVNLTPPVGPKAGTVINDGQVLGGSGSPGLNSGGGDVFIYARAVTNDGGPFPPTGGLIAAGTGHNAGWGGKVIINAVVVPGGFPPPPTFVTNANGGRILGGANPAGVRGGHVLIYSAGAARNLANSTISPGPCARVFFFGNPTTNNGLIIRVGSCPISVVLDPPDGVFDGDTMILGDAVNISGAQLTFGPFTNPNAIRADDTLQITVAPGGTLDLSGLTSAPQFQITAGNSITVRADTIVLPAGVSSIAQVMIPPPTVIGGARSVNVGLSPSSFDEVLLCGDPFELEVVAWNLGNLPDTLDLTITDSQGLLVGGPLQTSVPLNPIDWHAESILVQPGFGQPCGSTDVVVTLTSQADPSFQEVATYRVTWRCAPEVTTYCTAGSTTNGCSATMSASGVPSASASSSFVITCSNVEGQKAGLIFYGTNNFGFAPIPWGIGSTSFLCVRAPQQRTGTQSSGGTLNACDGTLTLDWNLFLINHPGALGVPFAVGDHVFAQAWFRDPPSAKTTNLSNAIEFCLEP